MAPRGFVRTVLATSRGSLLHVAAGTPFRQGASFKERFLMSFGARALSTVRDVDPRVAGEAAYARTTSRLGPP